ncbi:MAG: CAP domain-containing protein [Clostridia bacterium]|nr:CAP domain-containing protein [Clostridia bacterium]
MRSVLKKWLCLLTAVCMLCSLCAFSALADETATETEAGSTGVQGDANGDAVFNMKDVLTLRKYLANIVDTLDVVAADLNLDGSVNMKDVLLMRLMLAGYEVKNGTVSTTKRPTTTTKKPTTTTKKPTTTTAPSPYSAQQQEILTLVNAERKKVGLTALQLDEKACAAANVRAKEVPIVFDHVRPNGKSSFTALDDAGVSYISAGENIAKGYLTAEDVMNGWMNSEGHKANILTASFTHIGVGYDKTTHSWVQLFFTKTGSTFPADPETTAKMTAALLNSINKARTNKGLKAFTTNATLQAAATTLAKEQGKLGKMSFTRLDGSKYTTVLDQKGISYKSVNNHVGFCAACKTLTDALNVWAPNGDYSEWLDGSYTRIGIGYDETTGYWSILTLN